jgi:uncharacterized membrane protein YbhN (UPF0104 family)
MRLLRAAITIGLCIYLMRRFDLSTIRPILASADIKGMTAALLVSILGNLVYAVAARPLLKTAGALVPFTGLIRNHFLGLFFSLFLPSAVGGDVVRVIDLTRGSERVSLAAAGSMVLVQRILALIAALILIVVAMPFLAPVATHRAVTIAGAILIGVGVGFPLLALLSRRIERLRGEPSPSGFMTALRHASELIVTPRGIGSLLIAAVLVMASQLLFVAATVLISQALAVPVDGRHYLYVVPLAAVAVTAPVSLNGIGVREAVYIYYLGQLGIEPSQAASVSISLFVITILNAALGGMLYMRGSQK